MHIDFLGEHVELIPQIAAWQFEEWGHLLPGDSLENRVAGLKRRVNLDQVPLTLVALSGTVPVGTVALVESDLPGREDLSPWLANLLVPEKLRRQGIGTALVRRAVELAGELDHGELHLFAWEYHGFYHQLGWQTFEVTDHGGREISLMRIAADPAADGPAS